MDLLDPIQQKYLARWWQKLTRPRGAFLFVFLFLAGLLGASTYYYFWLTPTGRDVAIVRPTDADAVATIIAPRSTKAFTVPAAGHVINGVIVAAHRTTPPHFSIRLENVTSHTFVTSSYPQQLHEGGQTSLRFSTPALPSTTTDMLRLLITNTSNEQLALLSNSEGDLGVAFIEPLATPWEVRQGAAVALAFLLGASLLSIPRLHTHHWRIAALLLCVVAPTALASLWFDNGNWGVGDWDYRFSLHSIYLKTIQQFKEFPVWNPYTCGGTAGLADPEFAAISPTFLLELLFGIGRGTRAGIYLGVIITSLGMLQLSRSLGRSAAAALTAALITTYSSALLLRIVEGHVTIVYAYMWVPWIFWSWLRAYRAYYSGQPRAGRWSLWGGVFISLAFYQGGIYILSYVGLALVGLAFLIPPWRQAVRVGAVMLAWAAGFSALKLLPVLYWLMTYPDQNYAPSTLSFRYLRDIFLARHLHAAPVIAEYSASWHEYGAYIGYIALALVLLGLSQWRRHRAVPIIAIGALASLVISSAGESLQPIFDVLPFIPRSNISRLTLFTVMAASLLAAWGIDVLRHRLGRAAILVTLVVGVVSIDLFTLAYPLAAQTFAVQPIPPPPAATPPLQYTANEFSTRVQSRDYHRAYAATQAGYGVFTFCSVIGPTPSVATIEQASSAPSFISLLPPQSSATVNEWSPGSMTITTNAPAVSQVIVNMNYAPGWRAGGREAETSKGRLAFTVAAGEHMTKLQYHPPLFLLGLTLSILTILIAVVFLLRTLRTLP